MKFLMKPKTVFFILAGILIFGLPGCNERKSKKIDVSESKASVAIRRFDDDLWGSRGNISRETVRTLRKKYPRLFDLYCFQILNIGHNDDSVLAVNLASFLRDPNIVGLFGDAKKKFPDLRNVEKGFSDAFSHYRHYFPKKNIPEICAFVSAFNYAVISADSLMGISLDMYLGKKYPNYPQLNFPLYMIRKMEPEYIVPNGMKGWMASEYGPAPSEQKNLLGEMIYAGKILYCVSALMPDLPDSVLFGFTQRQVEFCRSNEEKIWSFFIDRKLLFSSVAQDYGKYIQEGPTTSGFPKESPGNIGSWMGYRIVNAFMEKRSSVTLESLMNTTDSQKILQESSYKPQKQ
jgi:hypothetical protein